MRRSAQQLVRGVMSALQGEPIPLPDNPEDIMLALTQLNVEATAATAQAVIELQGELEGIRQAILNLR